MVSVNPKILREISVKGVPRGRGKLERFFRSVDQLFLQDVPGYAPKGYTEAEATLRLPDFEQRFRTWLLEDYHHRVHSETACQPKERWEKGGFVPRMPMSLEQLDLLLLMVAKTRRVQQDGIHFQSHRFMDITLAAFVKEKEVFGRAGLDTEGMNLFCLFLEAGLPTPEMELVTTVGGPDWAGHEQTADVTSALLPLMVQFGVATEEEVQVKTLEQRLREEAARLQSVSMALGLMNVWTRVA